MESGVTRTIHGKISERFREVSALRILLVAVLFLVLTGSVRAAEMNQPIRQPAVAGAFYPADPGKLRTLLEQCLMSAGTVEVKQAGRLLAVFAPHAGYVYSGPAAGYAYQLLRRQGPKRIILLSPCHRQFLRGAAIDPRVQRTPLGDPVPDIELADELLAAVPGGVKISGDANDGEHALEVHVPFLQTVLNDFTLLSVMVGQHDLRGLEVLGKGLAALLRKHPDTVLVVSTDMSHFHPAYTAEKMDGATNRLIDALDIDGLAEHLDNGGGELCGQFPVLAAMFAVKELGVLAGQLLRYTHSGETSGDRSRVVGYSAHAFFSTVTEQGQTEAVPRETEKTVKTDQDFTLTPEEQQEILLLARRTLESWIRDRKVPPADLTNPKYQTHCGGFVTLKKHGDLRGCIGYIEGVKSLQETIQDMAVSASTRDPRFPPVTASELADISLEISVLSPVRPCKDTSEIEVGRHGIIIRQGGRSGLLLPQVAVEWNWDREQFLQHTCQKAGLPSNAWENGADIFIFSAQVFGED